MIDGRRIGGDEVYQIKLRGVLDERWSDWFNGMTVKVEQESDGSRASTLTGALDQSALHGILARIRDLNLKLISVTQFKLETPQIKSASDLEQRGK